MVGDDANKTDKSEIWITNGVCMSMDLILQVKDTHWIGSRDKQDLTYIFERSLWCEGV